MKLIQVSDLHFVPPGTRLFGIDPRAHLAAAIEDINAQHADAELCLFTGDLADHGDPQAYAALAETLAGLRPEIAEVFRLRMTSRLSFKEIAARQGVPLNTALGRMHNATKRLNAALIAAGLRKP